MTTENTPELIMSTAGGYHAWSPTKADEFRAAVAERSEILQNSHQQAPSRKYRRCSNQHVDC